MRKQLDTALMPPDSWRPAEADSGRISDRISERELERIPARLDWDAKGHGVAGECEVKLWDYSLTGFAVLLEGGRDQKTVLRPDDEVGLTLDLGQGPLRTACQIRNIMPFRNKIRVGMVRVDTGPGLRDNNGIPSLGNIQIPESVDITADVENPVLFGERSLMRLASVYDGLRMDFTTSDSSLLALCGTELTFHLLLPTAGDNRVSARIECIHRMEGGSLRLSVAPTAFPSGLANDLAELLATESGTSPDILKRLGFPIRFFRNRLVFRFVETMDEYAAVLALRRNAYVEAGKRDPGTDPEAMSLTWDRNSRILCAYHDGALVASAAMTFPPDGEFRLRTETAFPDSRFPIATPPRTELLEVNSLCTHKDFRKGDLLHAMFEQIGRIFILSDRKYIMNLSDENLLPMYLRIGFRDMRETGMFLGRKHHLIQLPRETIIRGIGMPIGSWGHIYGEMVRDLLDKRMLNLTAWERIMIRAKLSLSRPLLNANRARWNKRFNQELLRKKENDQDE